MSMLDLLGWSTDSVRWTPLQKQETKRIGGGTPVASPMPKSVLSEGREDQLLRELIFYAYVCVPFTDGVAWYL